MADGKLLFETKIDTTGLKKGLADVRAELSGMVNSNAYDNLKAAFEASQKEVLNFRAAVSETFDDGVFKVSRLNEEQRIFYEDLQKGTANIKRQWDSVNAGFNVTKKILMRIREAMLSLGAGALIAGIALLGTKIVEITKALSGFESATEKLSRGALLEQNKTLEESQWRAEQYAKGLGVLKKAQLELAEYMNKDRSWKERALDYFWVSDGLNEMLDAYYTANEKILKAGGISRLDFKANFVDEKTAAEFIANTQKMADAAQKNVVEKTQAMTSEFDKLNQELKIAEAGLYALAVAGVTSGKEWDEAVLHYRETADEIERIKNDVLAATSSIVSAEPAKQVESWSKSFSDNLKGTEYQSKGLLGGLLFGSDGDGAGIIQQLNDIDKALQENYNQQALLQGKKDEASRVALAGLKNEEAALIQQKESVKGYFEEYVAGIQAVGNAWSEFGAAVANGENPLTAFASSLKDSIANIIDMYADYAMAKALINSLEPEGQALSAKAFVQYFALKALAGFVRAAHFAKGGVVGGTRAQGDNVPILASAGEIVLNAAQQRNVAGAMGTSVNVIINNNVPDTSVTAEEDERGNVMIMIEQKVLETMSSPRGQKIIKSAGRGM